MAGNADPADLADDLRLLHKPYSQLDLSRAIREAMTGPGPRARRIERAYRTRYSAICTAFSAAPFKSWSPQTNMAMPLPDGSLIS